MKMLEIDLPVPDHTTLSRRACGLPVCKPLRVGTDELHLIVDSRQMRRLGEYRKGLRLTSDNTLYRRRNKRRGRRRS